MKKKSFLHHFQAPGHSDCMVYIFENGNERHVVFEDIGSGMSVTNATEQLAGEIVKEYKLDPEYCWFYETYRQFDHETFEEVDYTWVIKDGKWVASSPEWSEADNFKNIFLKYINK